MAVLHSSPPAPMTDTPQPETFLHHDIEKNVGSSDENLARTHTAVSRVTHSGDLIHLGNQTFLRLELEAAFPGSFEPGWHKRPSRLLASPGPMGLLAFLLSAFLSGLYGVGAGNVTNQAVLFPVFLWLGGVVQVIAGIWAMLLENTFAGTSFTVYGTFFLLYSFIVGNVGGFVLTYTSTEEFYNAMGGYFCMWLILTTMMLCCCFKSTYTMLGQFVCIWCCHLCYTVGCYKGESPHWIKAGSVFSICLALFGFYNAFEGLANQGNSYIYIKPILLPGGAPH